MMTEREPIFSQQELDHYHKTGELVCNKEQYKELDRRIMEALQ